MNVPSTVVTHTAPAKIVSFKSFAEQEFVILVGGALVLVAGLAWNNAVQALFNDILPDNPNARIILQFFYAFILTLIIIVILYLLFRATGINPTGS